MNKQRVLIYYDRWQGWSIYCNDQLLQLGFVDWSKQLQQFCNDNCKRLGFSIGLQGWEL
jgi:hypothetical protein